MKHVVNRLLWKKKKNTAAHYFGRRTTPFSSSLRHNKVSLLLLRPSFLCSYNNRHHPHPLGNLLRNNKHDDTTTTVYRFKSRTNNTRKACYHSSSSSFVTTLGKSKENSKPRDTKGFISLTAHTSASFSSSSDRSSCNRNHDDDYDLDGYRKALITEYYHNNEGLWRSGAIQKENEHTKRSIITDENRPLLYEEIYDELVGILREDEEKIGAVPPESGPTGRFSYHTKDGSVTEGRRIYYRKPNNDDPTAAIAQQTVWDISFRDRQLRAMSLSVDEALVAILVVDEKNEQEPSSSSPRKGTTRILLRHIETGKQTELDLPSHNNIIASIEFGPSVVAEQQQEETKDNDSKKPQQQQHSLYYVTTDRLGRPCTVWACAVREQDFVLSSSLPTKPPVRLYHSPEPDVMVDIQRTKGCRYTAIQASTKTSNEIYLSRCFRCSNDNNSSNEKNDRNTNKTKQETEPTIIRYCDANNDNDETLSFSLRLVRRRQPGIVYHVDVGTDDDVFLLACDSAAAAAPERQSDADDHNHNNELGPELALFETSISRLPLLSTNDAVGDSNSAFGTRIGGGSSTFDGTFNNIGSKSSDENKEEEYIIADMDLFRTFVALYETSTRDGRARIRIVNRQQTHDTAATATHKNEDRDAAIVPIPEDFVGIVNPGGNIHYDSRSLRFSLENPAHPGQTYEYCTVSHELKRLDDTTDRDDHNSNIIVDRVLVPNPSDGTQVPLSLVYQNDNINGDHDNSDGRSILPKDKKKIVLVGYGSYGQPLAFSYDPTILPLLRRGYVIAYAHVRGGGELGKSWYHGGRLNNKPNSIDDFLACARFLVAKKNNDAPSSVEEEEEPKKKNSSAESSLADNDDVSSSSSLSSWLLSFFSTTPSIQKNHESNGDNSETGSGTSPSPSSSSGFFDSDVLLTAKGYSAGGVVIGGAVNRDPSLFRNAVLTNAFLDVHATMKNKSLFLTEHEHEEYGNPSLDPLADKCIASYCPVSNIHQQTSNNMPNVLVIGSYDDEQVPFWNALLYAKALRRIHPVPRNSICLHIERHGGHHLHGTRLSVAALESTFIIKKDEEETMRKKHEG